MNKPEFVPTCETCRFAKINWRKGDSYEQGYTSGPGKTCQREHTSVQCRINPPTQGAFDGQADGWPWAAGDDWCGSWAAAQSQPAAEPVGDEVELIARALCPNGADETIDMPAWMLYLPEARRVISALRTSAREVPDESVPSWRFDNGMLAGKIDGDELANHLRDHNMKIVYRKEPENGQA